LHLAKVLREARKCGLQQVNNRANKLLILGDSPAISTGFGRVVRSLVEQWQGFFKGGITVWGIGATGNPHTVPCEIIRGGGREWQNPENLQKFIDCLKQGNYTHVWILQDTFCLSRHGFPTALRSACDRHGIKSYLYFPVDAALDLAWCEIVRAVDFPVAYTDQGIAEVKKVLGRATPRNLTRLPHGVDRKAFYPLPDRAAVRAKMFPDGWLQPENRLILNVNMFQRRKAVHHSLQVLSELRKAGDTTTRLFLHMRAMDQEDQIELLSVGEQLGLIYGLDWRCTGRENAAAFAGGWMPTCTEDWLNELYNAADVLLTTSLGEGWGLSITEALAAGCPVVAPDHTAIAAIQKKLVELTDGAAEEWFKLVPLSPDCSVVNYDNSRVRWPIHICSAQAAIKVMFQPEDFRVKLPPSVIQWLSWERIAAEWIHLFREPKPPKHHYLELPWGLGDCLREWAGHGAILDGMGPNDTAEVVITSHCPTVPELLAHHPKRNQITVTSLGYAHGPVEDRAHRREHQLPAYNGNSWLPVLGLPDIHPSPKDYDLCRNLGLKDYLVFAAGAGLPDRNVPRAMVDWILEQATAQGLPVVFVGKTYDRHGRHEPALDIPTRGMHVNLIDQLTVPGVLHLLRGSRGAITTHSWLNFAAWLWDKPQLLLYSDSVYQKHIVRKDPWAFGLKDPLLDRKTVHTTFDKLTPDHWDRLLKLVQPWREL
jgi:glycosyltransferase involved in cell wall biosynthesis